MNGNNRGSATCEDGWVKVFGIRRCILLNISHIIVERAVFAASLKNASIFYHLGVQVVKMLVWNHILHYHQTVHMNAADRYFEISLTESMALDFFGGRTNDLW